MQPLILLWENSLWGWKDISDFFLLIPSGTRSPDVDGNGVMNDLEIVDSAVNGTVTNGLSVPPS